MCYDLSVRVAGEVGFAAPCVDVGVAAEERIEGAGLVPARQELFGGIAEEAADVCAGEREAGDVVGEDHGDRGGQMRPDGLVVSCPHCAEALGAGVVGAGEDEGSTGGGWVAVDEGVERGVDEGHTVDVVDVAVFPVAMVDVILWHCGFGSIEDRGFVHVVPDEGVRSCTSEGFVGEERAPPFNSSRIEAVDPMRRARPAPAFVDVIVLVLDSE